MAWKSFLHKERGLEVLGDTCCRNGKCYEWNIDHSFRSLTTLWISVLMQKTNLLSVTTVHHRNRRNSESLSKYRATKPVLFGSWYSSKQFLSFKFLEVLKHRWRKVTGLTEPAEWFALQQLGIPKASAVKREGNYLCSPERFLYRLWLQNGWGWQWPLEVIQPSWTKLWISLKQALKQSLTFNVRIQRKLFLALNII